MRPLRNFLDRISPYFEKGQKLQKLYPVYEVVDSFFYTSDEVTTGTCHVRDGLEFKRMMSTVLVALVPCVLMAMYNTGLQANRAISALEGISEAPGWKGQVLAMLGVGYDPNNILADFVHGALYFLPIYIVCMAVGVLWELLFCVVRNHELNEGFFVTGLLLPLTLPANIPLWQVALGTTFGVVVAKEIFGGTGRNFLNPALAGRAFLFFAYPKQISGSLAVWTAGADKWTDVDGFSGATPLGAAGETGLQHVTQEAPGMEPVVEPVVWWDAFSGTIPGGMGEEPITWWDAFLGTIPGSMGETSTLACLIGAVILVAAGIGSWRIMLSMLIGAMGLAAALHFTMGASASNQMLTIPPEWHLVLGGFAFGLVFMATDPVTATMTKTGQYVYGVLIGAMVILVRVFNAGFPEGTMLAILFGNAFAPLIDYYVVRANIKRRALRHA